MPKQQDLWDYATVVFSLPLIELPAVSKTLGVANIEALSFRASEHIIEAYQELDDVREEVRSLRKKKRKSSLLIKEALAKSMRNNLVQYNMGELVKLLERLRAKAVENKFVLPRFRGVKHFEVGDEIMIYIGGAKDKSKVKYDWISAKMLCPGWDWVMHCHSNVQWTYDGGNGGHYFRTVDQDMLFKRSDFYGLRGMLERGEDTAFTKLLSSGLAKKILKGNVEALTDDELTVNQEAYIRRAIEVVNFYKDQVPIIAELNGVTV